MYNTYNPYIQSTAPQPATQFTNSAPQFTNVTTQKVGLQGKTVDSIEVVKATDVPFDGSISYFPLADGSGIVTKQLQMDGTSKIMVYKPIVEKEEKIEYLTKDALVNIENDINTIKKELKELQTKEVV